MSTNSIPRRTMPTGIPIIDCPECGHRHPENRKHCPTCGLATLFGHKDCAPRKETTDD